VAKIAADGAGVGTHRHGLQAHAGEGVQIGDEHAVVGDAGRGLVHVEGISVLHQELAPPHHAKARTALVAELPLDVKQVQRQRLVGLHIGPEDVGDHLLVGRSVQQLTLMPVGDAQHLGAVGVIAAALAPQISQLQGRHQQFDGPCPHLFLAHDLLDLAQHLQTQRQPGVDACCLLLDHAGAQHQLVRDDLGVRRSFLQRGQEKARQAHGRES